MGQRLGHNQLAETLLDVFVDADVGESTRYELEVELNTRLLLERVLIITNFKFSRITIQKCNLL